MIIRRKPVGFANLRKPQSLGMTLLRNGVSRLQALTIRRVPQSSEPIDWGEGIPDDVYDEQPVDESDYDAALSDAIHQAEAPTAAARPARSTAQRRSVQRQPAPTSAKPPAPPSSARNQRESLADSDTMPSDLMAIMNLHRSLGHLEPGALTPPSPPPNAMSRATSAAPPAVQRRPASDSPDGPRVRRRAQIVDITPPQKGLPFGDDVPDVIGAPNDPQMGDSHAPIQRNTLPSTAPDSPSIAEASTSGDSSESVLAAARALNRPAGDFDPGATALDLKADALQAAIARATTPSDSAVDSADAPKAVSAQRAVQPSIQRSPRTLDPGAMSRDIENRVVMPRSTLPADAAKVSAERTDSAPSSSFDMGDYDEPEDEPDPASTYTQHDLSYTSSIQRTPEAETDTSAPAAFDAPYSDDDPRQEAFNQAIARAEGQTPSATTQSVQRTPANRNAAENSEPEIVARAESPGPLAGTSTAQRTPAIRSMAENSKSETIVRAESHMATPQSVQRTPAIHDVAENSESETVAADENEAAAFGSPYADDDPRQEAFNQAIARAEGQTPLATTQSIQRTPVALNEVDDNIESEIASSEQNEAAAFDAPYSDDDPRQGMFNQAIARAEGHTPSAAAHSIQRTPSAPSEAAEDVEFEAEPLAPDASSEFGSPYTDDDLHQEAFNQAMARAEGRTSPDTATPIQRVPSFDETTMVESDFETGESRPSAPRSASRGTTQSVQPSHEPEAHFASPYADDDPRQEAFNQALARAEGRTSSDVATSIQRTPFTNEAMTANDEYDEADYSEYNESLAPRSVSRASATSVQPERDNSALGNPYTDADPHFSAFQQAIARVEGRAAPDPATISSPVQRIPSLEEEAISEYANDNAIDLYTALTGGAQVQTKRDDAPTLMPPIGQPSRAVRPADFQAMGRANSGYTTPAQPQVQRSPDRSRSNRSSPAASSTDADLLRMLNLPENTPVRRGSTSTHTTSAGDSASGTVQRELNQEAPTVGSNIAPSLSVSNALPTSGEAEEKDDPAEIEKMAQAVYRILRQKLKIERERSQGRVR